jgi:hypothetical protein
MLRILVSTVLASSAILATQRALALSEGWVVLPVEEYRALKAKADPSEPEPPETPVDATLTRVDYDLRAAGDVATGEARLTIDVLKEGWVRVPVPPGILVRGVRMDGRVAALLAEPESGGKSPAGGTEVLLSRAGRALVALDVAVPVVVAAGSAVVALPASGAALTHATVTLAEPNVELTASGGLIVERSEVKGATRFVCAAHPGASLSLTWKRKRADARASQAARLRGSLTHLVGIGEEGTQASVIVKVELVEGALRSARVEVPEAFVVNQVVGANVADWELAGGVLVVSFLDPVDSQTGFVVTGEVRTPRDGKIAIPLLRLAAAERETGGVAVEVVGAGEIRAREARGLDPADAADLGDVVAGRDSPALNAFRFQPGPGKVHRSLSVDIARYTPKATLMANIEEARYHALVTEDGKALVQALYAVRNNQRSFLKVALPKDATLWSAAVARRPVRPGRAPDGALLVPLEKGRVGEEAPAFLVEVVYFARDAVWGRSGRGRFALPALDLGVSRLAVEWHYPPRFRTRLLPGPLRESSYEPPRAPAFSAAPQEAKADAGKQEQVVENLGMVGRNAAELMRILPGVIGPSQDDKARDQRAEQVAAEVQGLVERYQKDAGRAARVAGALPVQVPFPDYGPSLFCVAELTPEGTAPVLDFQYARTK